MFDDRFVGYHIFWKRGTNKPKIREKIEGAKANEREERVEPFRLCPLIIILLDNDDVQFR